MPTRALSKDEIRGALATLSGWTGDEGALRKRYQFDDFPGAMRFMQRCIEGIERLNHHPSWTNTYNTVDVVLNTHDLGGKVSELDVELARHLDQMASAI
jgi:4a-hydroxytetrahydrobiopterin dehydratase